MLPITRATAHHFCRACLLEFEFNAKKKAKNNTHNIEDEQGLEKCFRITTTNATNLETGHHSNPSSCGHLPKNLCHTCYMKTKVFYEYREKAFCANEAFKQLIAENLQDTAALSYLHTFCRTCLRKLKSCNTETNLYENEELRRWLFECTGLGVNFTSSADDELNGVLYEPKYMCNFCYVKLRKYLEFRGLAQQSFEYLENILGLTTIAADDVKPIGDSNKSTAVKKKTQLAEQLDKPEENLSLTENTQELASTEIFVEPLPAFGGENAVCFSDNSSDDISSRHSADFSDESDDEDTKKQLFGIEIPDKNPIEKENTSINEIGTVTLVDSDKLTDNKTKKSKRRITTPLKKIKCEQCNKHFRKQSTHDAHVRAIHEGISTQPKRIKCEQCSKQFLKQSTHDAHVRDIHENIKETYPCELCSKVYQQTHYLRRHRKEVHKVDVLKEDEERRKVDNSPIIYNGDSYTCAICFRIFKRRDHLDQHISVVHKKIRPHKCSYCERSFGELKSLRVHEMVHTNTRPHACEYCPKRFIQINDLHRHTEIHTTSPELICPICKRAKSNATELQEHLAAHKARMQHQCSKCGRIFKKRSKLTEHDNAVHLKLRPHKCNYCEITFASRKTRDIHERTHTGERPEVCPICQKAFAQLSTLRAHMKRHEIAKVDENKSISNNIFHWQ